MILKNSLRFVFATLSIIVLFTSCFHEDNRIHTTCFDEVLNQEEEFVDCGGPNCDECPPTCDNGILDDEEGWIESGVDCGGPCPSCCDNDVWDVNPNHPELSEEWIDCGGVDPLCGPCETCNNGQHDPGEEMTLGGVLIETIDCDDDITTDCPPCTEYCDDGLLNGAEGPCADCGGVCSPCDFAHCENGVQDTFADYPAQSETDVDCGGCGCPSCDALCSDGLLNGSEEAIDCGGDDCVSCDDIILCSDGVQNGYETGIDCYDGTASDESSCPPCNSLCFDLILNGNERDTDCGGDDCPPCAVEDQSFLIYTVDYEISGSPELTESNVPYESKNSTIVGLFTPGVSSEPADYDVVQLQGGLAHTMSITLQDTDVIDTFFSGGAGSFTCNSSALVFVPPILDNVALITNNGIQFESKFSSTGIVFSSFSFSTTPTIPPLQVVTGSFSGTLATMTGDECTITNGSFSVIIP